MTTLVAQPDAIATLSTGLALKVKTASVDLDESWSPYAQGQLVCELPTGADRAAIDLRAGALRVSLQLRRDFGHPWKVSDLTALSGGSAATLTTLLAGGPAANLTHLLFVPWIGSVERPSDIRNFDLFVRERDFDDKAKELRLSITSDEALLLGDGLAAGAAWDPGTTDLATICAAVLARYGAKLTAQQTATVSQQPATLWQPGDSAQTYLSPLLEAASLRLWCDENRAWTLGPREATVAGSVVLSPSTMESSKDSMTLDPQTWADAVVVKYTWTDSLGVNQVRWDYAGAQPAKAMLPVERPNTVYPGVGAAAGILSRLQGRGRVLEVTADQQLGTTPGQGLAISPPDTSLLAGYVSSVSFRFPEDEMDVTTRGLTDVPAGSSLAGNNATFASVAVSAPTLKIKDFDWSLV